MFLNLNIWLVVLVFNNQWKFKEMYQNFKVNLIDFLNRHDWEPSSQNFAILTKNMVNIVELKKTLFTIDLGDNSHLHQVFQVVFKFLLLQYIIYFERIHFSPPNRVLAPIDSFDTRALSQHSHAPIIPYLHL